MSFDPTVIQKFSGDDPSAWLQVGAHQAFVGYIADEDEGSRIGIAYIRFRAGTTFEFLWAYDEVAVVTKGSLSIRTGDEVVTARAGEFLYMPSGVPGDFEVLEDMEAVCVHYPTDAKAGREWLGPVRRPKEEEIHPVTIADVWP